MRRTVPSIFFPVLGLCPRDVMGELSFFRVTIPFRQNFRHSSAERTETQTVWVEATSGAVKGVGEGCPREYVTGESLVSARRFLAGHHHSWEASIDKLEDLHAWVTGHQPLIDANPAAWCAVELAYLDLFGREQEETVERILSLPPIGGVFRYTAVVGDSSADTLDDVVRRYRSMGFSDFKLKLSGDLGSDREKISILKDHGISEDKIRVDANNLWSDRADAIHHLSAMDVRFFGVEEPLTVGGLDALRWINRETGCPIILDESFTRVAQLESLASDPSTWTLNVRVSKMGGIIRSLAVLSGAVERDLRVIVGAHVGETSLLTRAGMLVARAAGESLAGHEGAFGTILLAEDVCDPPLMFGMHGELDAGVLGLASRSGWGIEANVRTSIFASLG